MSVSYSAKAVIGLRIPKEKLYTEQLLVHRHGESSGRGNMYCPNCGCKLPEPGQTEWVPVWAEGGDSEELTIAGYPLLLGPIPFGRMWWQDRAEWAIMPAIVATDDEYWLDKDESFVPMPSIPRFDVQDEALKINLALSRAGLVDLWDPDQFGLFAVLEAS